MPTKDPPHAGETAIVLLAAGAGTRFQDTCHKLLASLTESSPTVFELALQHAVESNVGQVVVVTGSLTEADLPFNAADPANVRVTFTHNPDWADGQSTSVHAGIRAAARLGATCVTVGLADQPFIEPDAWRRVSHGWGKIRVATYDGRRGNPVRLHANVWGLLPTSGDEGARVLMRQHPDLIHEVPCSGSPADIDTVEDLHTWQSN